MKNLYKILTVSALAIGSLNCGYHSSYDNNRNKIEEKIVDYSEIEVEYKEISNRDYANPTISAVSGDFDGMEI